jgi:Glycosyl hydrolases family 25
MPDLAIADVSEFQATINWAAYGATYPAVIVRIHNSNRPDNFWRSNVDGARAHCQWRGFYQYLTAGADPVAAAHAFQATIGTLQPGEVAILDLEEGGGDQRGRRDAWLGALQDKTEWVYSGQYFARAHLGGKVDWIAAYGSGEPGDPHKLWQNTNARFFVGIAHPCDGSIYHGSLAQLQAISGGSAPVVHPTPAPPVHPVYAIGDVMHLQSAVGAAPDGKWGNGTDANAVCLRAAGIGSPINILLLQKIVGVKTDGNYGPISKAAVVVHVKMVQAALKVAADGGWGPITDRAFNVIRAQFHNKF